MATRRDKLKKRIRDLSASAYDTEKILQKASESERSILEIGLKALRQEIRKLEKELEKR